MRAQGIQAVPVDTADARLCLCVCLTHTKVSRPQQYLWDRLGLLGKVCGLATSLAACREGQAFVTALAAEPDMDIDTLKQVSILWEM